MYAKSALYPYILLIDTLQGQLGQPPAPRRRRGQVRREEGGRATVDISALFTYHTIHICFSAALRITLPSPQGRVDVEIPERKSWGVRVQAVKLNGRQ